MAGLNAKNRAVFLDRDGVIVEHVHYLRNPSQLRLISGAARAIMRLRKAGFKAVVISNQSAVARGYLTERRLEEIHCLLRRHLKEKGARLDAVFYCPHHPRKGRRCNCRKPRLGMLKAAARRFNLDLKSCYLIGDTTTDIRTAQNAGCRGLLVMTGKGGHDRLYKAKPVAVSRDIGEAAKWILEAERRR